jgi:hypothetical protein
MGRREVGLALRYAEIAIGLLVWESEKSGSEWIWLPIFRRMGQELRLALSDLRTMDSKSDI